MNFYHFYFSKQKHKLNDTHLILRSVVSRHLPLWKMSAKRYQCELKQFLISSYKHNIIKHKEVEKQVFCVGRIWSLDAVPSCAKFFLPYFSGN